MENPHLAGQEKKIWLQYAFVGVIVIAALWIWTAWELHDLSDSTKVMTPDDRRSEQQMAWIPGVLGTLGSPLLYWYLARRAIAMLKNGVPVLGTVLSHGLIGRGGMKAMTVEYEVDGQNHTIKLDAAVKDNPVGSRMLLLRDPNNPKHAMTAAGILKGEALAFAKQEAEKTSR